MKKIDTQTGIILGAVAFAALGGFVWWKASQKKAEAENAMQDKETQDRIDKALDEAAKAETATLTKAQAKSIANQLYNAMKDAGTDEDTIMRIMGNYNGTDLAMINAAFDLREYWTHGAKKWYNFGDGDKLPLIDWFRKELSGDYLEEVENRFRVAKITGICGYTGSNYKPGMTMSDITKAIRQRIKESDILQGCKFSVTKDGLSVRITLKSSPYDVLQSGVVQDGWPITVNHYNIDRESKLTDYGKAVFTEIWQIAQSYNYDKSEAMIDYFDTNFYLHLYVAGDYFIDSTIRGFEDGSVELIEKISRKGFSTFYINGEEVSAEEYLAVRNNRNAYLTEMFEEDGDTYIYDFYLAYDF